MWLGSRLLKHHQLSRGDNDVDDDGKLDASGSKRALYVIKHELKIPPPYPVKDGESTPWRQDKEITRALLFLNSSLVTA